MRRKRIPGLLCCLILLFVHTSLLFLCFQWPSCGGGEAHERSGPGRGSLALATPRSRAPAALPPRAATQPVAQRPRVSAPRRAHALVVPFPAPPWIGRLGSASVCPTFSRRRRLHHQRTSGVTLHAREGTDSESFRTFGDSGIFSCSCILLCGHHNCLRRI